jgi:hypothetical protein
MSGQVFRPDFQIDVGFGTEKDTKYARDYDKAACALGRLVIVCRYLRHTDTLKAMSVSLTKIDAALNELDKNPPDKKPADMDVTYRAAHQKWFEDMWRDGINKLRKTIVDGAEWLKEREAKFQGLPKETQDKVNAIDGDKREETLAELCPSAEFSWPTGTPSL